jgi:hypothetical protein
LSGFSSLSARREFRGSRSVYNRAGDWNVRKFLTILGATQHQSTTTHITPANKIRRKPQPLAKVCHQYVDVFARGDAAEEYHFTLR